ncbi:hypothetical protein [Chryseobacterium sp. JUb7]|uniref:hypothetical protein n=1 Tax=Chryseobacterium sp. JUb7 TaxID=2940599 RepID=UPI002168A64D|nr:hypothetical protein [Chryseobacterium sp. JUb7]MCS3532835.1 hypothetical protein [Chryseobacterium sp. JUb7]
MKNIFSIIALFVFTTGCFSQINENKNFKFFDIDTFNKHKRVKSSIQDARDTLKRVVWEVYEFKKEDSLIYMEKLSTVDSYKMIRSKIGGSYKKVYIYHPNYSLFIESHYFLDLPIGHHKKYSGKGDLIEDINYDQIRKDEGYPISIFDIAQNMRNDFKIDIEKEDQILRWRIVKDDDLKKAVYKIACPPKYPDGRPPRGFIYDPVTGKFIEEYRVDDLR